VDVPRWASGRECWVFRAATPVELCGHHPRLISSVLRPGEPVHYLLYSPVFDARDAPFGVSGVPGSHSVGITSDALLVSRDLHTDEPARSVARIALDAVSCVVIGGALALGWFVVRYSAPHGPASCTVLFASRGAEEFRAIVRAYRRLGREERAASDTGLEWPMVWPSVPTYVRTELEPLVEEGERPLAVLRTPERWTAGKGWWRRRSVCTSAPGLLVATARGLLWAAGEPRPSPEALSFGVNVTVVRPDRVQEAAIGCGDGLGVLRLRCGGEEASHDVEVPFDGDDLASATEIVRLGRAWRASA
jgi:hypothetical protein